jgi:uncharacterized protein
MRWRTYQALVATLLLAVAGCTQNDRNTGLDATSFHPDTLLDSVLMGDEAAVKTFLAKGEDPNATETDGTTLLMRAIHGRHPRIAQVLIEAGANVAAGNRYGVTPLYLAAQVHDATTARALLTAGADANTALPEGETVLMTAAKDGSLEIVRALLGETDAKTEADAASSTSRADPNAKEGWYGQTALMWAAAEGHTEIISALLRAGANVNQRSDLFDAPEPHPDSLQEGFAYPRILRGRLTALHFAARQGKLEAARTLVEAGADLDATDEDGADALILATLNGHLDLASMLLEAGANPNIADSYGRTVLFAATDLDADDASPQPAPATAEDLSPVDLVKLALNKGANPDAALTKSLPSTSRAQAGGGGPGTAEGATPLLRAAATGDLEIMHLLLGAGANPLVATTGHPAVGDGTAERFANGGTTALMAAAGVGWRESESRGHDRDAIQAIELLLDHGADVNATNQSGETALHGATLRGSTAIIQFLVDHGANLYAKNARGWTPLDIAMGQPEERIPYNEATASLLRRLMQRS